MQWLERSMENKTSGEQDPVSVNELVCQICHKKFKSARAMRNHVVNPCSKPPASNIESDELWNQSIKNENKACADVKQSFPSHAELSPVQSRMEHTNHMRLEQPIQQKPLHTIGMASTVPHVDVSNTAKDSFQGRPYPGKWESILSKNMPIVNPRTHTQPIVNGNEFGTNKLRTILEAADFLNSGIPQLADNHMHVPAGSELSGLLNSAAVNDRGRISSGLSAVGPPKMLHSGNTAYDDLYANLSSISDAADLLQFSSQEFNPTVETKMQYTTNILNNDIMVNDNVNNWGQQPGHPPVTSTKLVNSDSSKPSSIMSMQTTSYANSVQSCSVPNHATYANESTGIPIVESNGQTEPGHQHAAMSNLKDEIEGLKMLIEVADKRPISSAANCVYSQPMISLPPITHPLEQSQNTQTVRNQYIPHAVETLATTSINSSSQQAPVLISFANNELTAPQIGEPSTDTPVICNIDDNRCNEYVIQLPHGALTDNVGSEIRIPGHLFDQQTQQLIIVQNDDPDIDQQLLGGSEGFAGQSVIILQEN